MTTIKDVSRIAGVSIATVSRTLRNPEKVSEKTREIVLKAIEETGYQPNMLASSFRTKKSNAILVLVPNMANLFYSRVIRGIQQVAEETGYNVLLGDTGGDVEIENRYSGFALTKQVDGVIQLSKHLPKTLEKIVLNENPFPYVNACEYLDDRPFPTIGVDNEAAQYQITEHLIQQGHRKFAVITGANGVPVHDDRLRGFHRAMIQNRLGDEKPIICEGDFSLDSGAECARKVLIQDPSFTGLICFSDEMAIGALQTLKEFGKKTPEDISVTGFDDIEFARYADPPLTTMRQPTTEIGEVAAKILFAQMEGTPIENTKIRLPTEMIIRASTQAPAT